MDVGGAIEGQGHWGGVQRGCSQTRCPDGTVRPTVASSWQVSSFSETKAQQILQQKPAQYLRFNQHQLSRIYPSSYRVDSSNYNPQPFWNAGCQMGGCLGPGAAKAAGAVRGMWPDSAVALLSSFAPDSGESWRYPVTLTRMALVGALRAGALGLQGKVVKDPVCPSSAPAPGQLFWL